MEERKRSLRNDDQTDEPKVKRQLRPVPRVDYHDSVSLKELKGRQYILKKYTNSSDIPCHFVKYFTYLINEDRFPEICLKEASVVECLYQAFKFTANVGNEEVKVSGRTIEEIYEHWKNQKGFLWISEHDQLNFHDLSGEDYFKEMTKVKDFITEFDEKGEELEQNDVKNYHCGYVQRGLYAKYVDAISQLFEDIYYNDEEIHTVQNVADDDSVAPSEGSSNTAKSSDSMKDTDKRSRLVKIILGCAAEFLPNHGGPKKYLSNGECKRDFPLFVKNADLTEDNQLVEDKECVIVVKPDGVFFQRAKNQKNQTHLSPYVWKLVVEVYGPLSDKAVAAQSPIYCSPMTPKSEKSSSPATPDHKTAIALVKNRVSKKKKKDSSPVIIPEDKKLKTKVVMGPPEPPRTYRLGVPLPMRTVNWMTSSDYCANMKENIKASIPKACSTQHCMDKLAGQHVLQLFAMAHQRMRLREDDTLATGVGLFMVNEFVYFSRLVVPSQTLHYLNTGNSLYDALPALLANGTEERPKVTYGNFRFDLTLANHRQAFVIFLKEFVCSKS